MGKRKATDYNPNHDLCDFLLELADYEKNITRNIYKYNAYNKAAAILAAQSTRVTSGAEAKKLSGVGNKISEKIDEYLTTGKLQKLENIHHDKTTQAINLLTRVSGIGPAKARKLVEEGISTIEDLRKHKDTLNHHQIIGLKRGRPESGDIDTLVTHPDYTSKNLNKSHNDLVLKHIVERLETCGLITETLSLGDTKFMGTCQLNLDLPTRRLDIRFQPYDQYYCNILYFTGSDIFNQRMRAHALEQGFTLNEYTLRPVGSTGIPGEAIEINSEEEIFDIINYPCKNPEERNN
ncbi:DNA polymerase beta-like isoform X2 [Euwallacea similis]|uniref:DNA polymerase beta-like isoform X2 n=1 Tax=Euwallacea similis TaxID=1736056 RepID=UPI00344C449E